MRSAYFGTRRGTQGASAAIEFALVCVILFSFIFGTIELARARYLWNTPAEVVNRAARMDAFANLINCTNAPLGATCIRIVRLRLGLPDTNGTTVPFQPMVGFAALNGLKMKLPTFATVVAAESLGLPAACP